MDEQRRFNNFWRKLGGYYLIPHELLHVLAYRLIGKPCRYRWGDYRVRPLAKVSGSQKLFVLLLPFLVCWLFVFFFSLLWLSSAFFINIPPERYFIDGPTWHIVFLLLASLFVLYSGTAFRDIRVTLQLLSKEDQPQDHGPASEQQAN